MARRPKEDDDLTVRKTVWFTDEMDALIAADGAAKGVAFAVALRDALREHYGVSKRVRINRRERAWAEWFRDLPEDVREILLRVGAALASERKSVLYSTARVDKSRKGAAPVAVRSKE